LPFYTTRKYTKTLDKKKKRSFGPLLLKMQKEGSIQISTGGHAYIGPAVTGDHMQREPGQLIRKEHGRYIDSTHRYPN
jgi:hypothetical protein